MSRANTTKSEGRSSREILAGCAIVFLAIALDIGLLRSLLRGRQAHLQSTQLFLLPFALLQAFGLAALGALFFALVRRARAEGEPEFSGDSRRLLFGSLALVSLYLGFHAATGPLMALVMGGDAFVVSGAMRASYPTYAAAALHSLGLVAIGAAGLELSRFLARPSRRRSAGALALVFALVHGALALDPIATLTIGRPIFVELREDATVILPSSSATVPSR